MSQYLWLHCTFISYINISRLLIPKSNLILRACVQESCRREKRALKIARVINIHGRVKGDVVSLASAQ